MCGNRFLQSPGPADLCRCTDGSLYAHKIHRILVILFLQISLQPFHGTLPFQIKIRADPCRIQVFILYRNRPVDHDHRNPCFFRLHQGRVPPRLDAGIQNDIIHILVDEFPDRFDLIFLFLLSVIEQKRIRAVRKCFLDRSGTCHSPVRLRSDLRKADSDALRFRRRRLLFFCFFAPAGGKHCCQQQYNPRQTTFLHSVYCKVSPVKVQIKKPRSILAPGH